MNLKKTILSKLGYVEIPSRINVPTLDIYTASEIYLKGLLRKMKWLLGESYLSNQIDLLLECETVHDAKLLAEKLKEEGIEFIITEKSQPNQSWEINCEIVNEKYICSVKLNKGLILYINSQEIVRIN